MAINYLEQGSASVPEEHDTSFPPRASTSTREPTPNMQFQLIVLPLEGGHVVPDTEHCPVWMGWAGGMQAHETAAALVPQTSGRKNVLENTSIHKTQTLNDYFPR